VLRATSIGEAGQVQSEQTIDRRTSPFAFGGGGECRCGLHGTIIVVYNNGLSPIVSPLPGRGNGWPEKAERDWVADGPEHNLLASAHLFTCTQIGPRPSLSYDASNSRLNEQRAKFYLGLAQCRFSSRSRPIRRSGPRAFPRVSKALARRAGTDGSEHAADRGFRGTHDRPSSQLREAPDGTDECPERGRINEGNGSSLKITRRPGSSWPRA
jgi:hypothetical protein